MRALLLQTVALAVALVALARATSGCLNVTPVVVENDAEAPTNVTCLPCLQRADRCADIIEACEAEPGCKRIYDCMVERQCLNMPTLALKVKTGLQCAQDNGVTTPDDPLIQTYFVSLVGCGSRRCAVECNIGDAGADASDSAF